MKKLLSGLIASAMMLFVFPVLNSCTPSGEDATDESLLAGTWYLMQVYDPDYGWFDHYGEETGESITFNEDGSGYTYSGSESYSHFTYEYDSGSMIINMYKNGVRTDAAKVRTLAANLLEYTSVDESDYIMRFAKNPVTYIPVDTVSE